MVAGKHGEYEMVLTNPPFGKKSSVTIVNEAGDEEKQSLVVHRDDFWASTSNKQLNFLQHVFTILKQHGRAAILVPESGGYSRPLIAPLALSARFAPNASSREACVRTYLLLYLCPH